MGDASHFEDDNVWKMIYNGLILAQDERWRRA